jgi:hypothetical protein
MKLSNYFSLDEFTRSSTATALGISNTPTAAQQEQLRLLAVNVLDPLRVAAGVELRVSSGFRGPALNAKVGGSATSQHSLGQAADLQSDAMSALELFKVAIRAGLAYDQIIYEAKSATSKWVHLSHAVGANRGEIRVAQFDANGKATSFPKVTAEQALAMTEPVSRGPALESVGETFSETLDEPVHRAPRAKKPAAKKAAPKKAAAKKPVVKKAAKKTVAAKKAPTKKAPAKKVAPKKAAAKKVAAKKVVAAKPAAKKASAKKAPPKKTAGKKAAPRKSTSPTAKR